MSDKSNSETDYVFLCGAGRGREMKYEKEAYEVLIEKQKKEIDALKTAIERKNELLHSAYFELNTAGNLPSELTKEVDKWREYYEFANRCVKESNRKDD
jgi:hypothetical protein